ncbi:PatB family C-S lyase [Paenibacillus sp. N1-5-1-14]|uniref:MalY/PatB family protein n=1 Tax=Paenibacillus radicibacter TaxID=2972488 RepID=UPI0021597821|nr:PatB family C-S lyase [Paenibacillus radicibacter]MCR8642685.1 PatB family C-S lyase [Paenibacillus radicibacter]
MTYNFDEVIDRTNSFAVKTDFKARNHIPEDALAMWVADMDFATPPAVTEAISKRLSHPIYGYTHLGDNKYEAAIAWMKERHNWNVQADWIVHAPGVVPALGCIARAFLNTNEKLIIQQPVYPPFMSVPTNNQFEYLNNELVRVNGTYEMDLEDFEQKASDPAAKLFILCNPHNPVGRVWSKETLLQIADICLRHDILIVSDEIHHDLVFKGNTHIPMASLSPEISQITITCTAPSKTFNMAGLQAANIIIENPDLRARFVKELNRVGMETPNVFAGIASEAAYREGAAWLEQAIDYIEGNKQYVIQFAKEKLPMLHVLDSEATYLLWIDFNQLGLQPKRLQHFLNNEALVWMNAGSMFGESGNGFARMNIACPRSVVIEAMDRIERAIRLSHVPVGDTI